MICLISLLIMNLCFFLQVKVNVGEVTYYVSNSAYPNEGFFDKKVVATVRRRGVIFLRQPPTEDVYAEVYCNIKGNNGTDSNVTVGVQPGGIVKLFLSIHMLFRVLTYIF